MKSKSLFDCIADVTFKKTDVNTYTENDWKVYNPYMIHRFLSMNKDLVGIMNLIQKYYTLDKKIHYILLSDILPKQKFFTKYIKGKKVDKYNAELIKLIARHYEIPKDQAIEYIDMFMRTNGGINHMHKLLEMYGKSKKEIKGLLK